MFDSPQLPNTPSAPPAPPLLGQAPQGKKPQAKPMQPTFLGAGAAASPAQTGQKTLLGQ